MRIVTANEWQQWLAQGKVLEKDIRGPKVLRLDDGRILKIFRPRRKLWLARLLPQARRFARNAAELAARGFAVPQPDECLWVERARAVCACLYPPLPGESLAQIWERSPAEFAALLPDFAAFIHQLHQRGVYFRSLHLGNVLRLPAGGFGLIDFLDTRFHRGPLGRSLVQRNLQHLQGYLQRNGTRDFPWQQLLDAYQAAAGR